ncbi:MAG: DUF296 domain-containing protein [Candidatus Omnitrophota bacterium]
MEYTKGSIGRIFLLKFTNGDDIHCELRKLARKEKVCCAVLFFIGALNRGHLVTGPKKPEVPPEPNWASFKDGWETLGLGTIFRGGKDPKIHIHVSMGKKDKMLTGCLRKESEVFLVMEAVLFELKGVRAAKDIDLATGLELLRIIKKKGKRS